MGILNITPDSFSGDGLLRTGHAVGSALDAGRQMVAAGADLLDVGGESTRPGGTVLSIDEERERVVPVLRGLRAAFPDVPLSIDTIKPEVAEAALDAGADLLNDVWGVRDDPAMLASRPLGRAHRPDARPRAGLSGRRGGGRRRPAEGRRPGAGRPACAMTRSSSTPASASGRRRSRISSWCSSWGAGALGRPIVLGHVPEVDARPAPRPAAGSALEATLATTALGIAAGVDMVRVHDVEANVRAARTADAILRGWRPAEWRDAAPPGPTGVLPLAGGDDA